MPEVARARVLPYSSGELYALVEDIESYPEFVPGCARASILLRTQSTMRATLHVASGALRRSFTTENTLDAGNRIMMRLVNGPFRYLEGQWSFDPLGNDDCRMGIELRFRFLNPVTALLFDRAISDHAATLIEVFAARAREVYGTR